MELLGTIENITMENSEENSHYYGKIGNIMSQMHSNIPDEVFNTAIVPTSTNYREEYYNGNYYSRAVIYLFSNGCEWALKSGNGCTMCGHLAQQTRTKEQINDNDLIIQFKNEFRKIDFSKSPILNIFNNGSFFNEKEISKNARREILKVINSEPNIKMLVVETRPEFISEEKIIEFNNILPNIHLEVAIGLEMKDDYFRMICINKGFKLDQYKKAAEIITKHVNLRTYVLLKPPFLTEVEAIDEACETIEYSFSLGSRLVSLEGCTVQDYTLIKYLYDNDMYSPPKLWSILDVIQRVGHKGQLVIGMFQFYPSPNNVPNNCDLCNEKILNNIKLYNRTLDMSVFESLSCKCKEEWDSLLKEISIPFNERVKCFIDKME